VNGKGTVVKERPGPKLVYDEEVVEVLWFQNFFCPTMKLKKKKRIGARYHRVYEKARTPYALLRATFED